MKDTTFGDSRAAISLTKMLTKINDQHLNRRLGWILTRAYRGFREIESISDPGIRQNLNKLWYDFQIELIRKNIALIEHPELISYAINICHIPYAIITKKNQTEIINIRRQNTINGRKNK